MKIIFKKFKVIHLMLEFIKNNIKYKLGRNAKDNFDLIDEAYQINENYWWFHLDNHPSGHCIVHSELLDKSDYIYAALLIKQYSKLREQKKVKIVCTQIKNIKKTKTLGQVVIINNSPMTITI